MGRPAATPEQLERAREVHERLVAACEGKRREQIARDSFIERKTLDRYLERLAPAPSFFLIADLANALGVDLSDLARRPGGAR